jgi:hypothetical protein
MSKPERERPKSFFDFQPTLPFAAMPDWLGVHAQMLATMQTMTERWFAHRRRGFDSLMTAMAQLSNCKDPAAFAAAHQQWIAENSEHLAEEITALRADALSLAQAATASLDAFPDKLAAAGVKKIA